jgi:putative alpha-1,2-mannosidase
MVPYDLPDLFAAMGGNAKVVARLDNHFTQLNAGPASRYAFMGNEPEFEVPWEYDFAGAAYRTQDVIQRIETQLFLATPDGLPGNDDGGAMSSWYVFAALGLYPEIPGVAGFALGSPLFPTITVHLGNGHTLSIQSAGLSATAYYVQSLKVNGQAYTSAWLPFSMIMNGATLQYTMGSSPDTHWGA